MISSHLHIHSSFSSAAAYPGSTNNVDKWVQVTDGSEKLRTNLARVEGLAELDVNIGDLVVLEKG